MGDDYGGDFLSSEVKSFVKRLSQSIRNREMYETLHLYEEDFQNLTERYFKASSWPLPDTVASVVENDQNFLILYKELYFRHIYSKLTPSVDDRLDSFENYVNLFNILISLSSEEPELELPPVWMWDIIDEFVCQFRSFHQFRTNVPNLQHEVSPEELQALKDNEHHWSARSVIRYLITLAKKAGVSQIKNGVSSGTASPMFRIVGEFSQIGLARVQCLLGDYTSSLQALDKINFGAVDVTYPRVCGCHASLQYTLGTSYMMLKRFSDAVNCFSGFLSHLNLSKAVSMKPHQEDVISNMYGLLAICLALSPETVEDSLDKALNDKYGDRRIKMTHGDLATFEEMFYENCPAFVTARAPDYDKEATLHQEALKLQSKVLLDEVRQRAKISDVHSYLKLCTSITVTKLAAFLKVEEGAVAGELLAIKHKTKQIRKTGGLSAPPSSGEWTVRSAQVPFFVDKEVVNVAEAQKVDRYGQTFMTNMMRYEDLIDDVRSVR